MRLFDNCEYCVRRFTFQMKFMKIILYAKEEFLSILIRYCLSREIVDTNKKKLNSKKH